MRSPRRDVKFAIRAQPPETSTRDTCSLPVVDRKKSNERCVSATMSSVTVAMTPVDLLLVSSVNRLSPLHLLGVLIGQAEIPLKRLGIAVAADRDVAGKDRDPVLQDIDVHDRCADIEQRGDAGLHVSS